MKEKKKERKEIKDKRRREIEIKRETGERERERKRSSHEKEKKGKLKACGVDLLLKGCILSVSAMRRVVSSSTSSLSSFNGLTIIESRREESI